jgi:hypothetical protein
MNTLRRYSRSARRSSSFIAIANMLPALNDLSYQTIMLRTGLALGFVRSD